MDRPATATPATAREIILEIVRREDFSFKQLASVIQSDPALLARILRLANSGFYGLPKKISSIDTAVATPPVSAPYPNYSVNAPGSAPPSEASSSSPPASGQPSWAPGGSGR